MEVGKGGLRACLGLFSALGNILLPTTATGEGLAVGEGFSLTAPLLSLWFFNWHSQEPRAALGTAAVLGTVFPDVPKLCVLPGGADFVINALPCSGIHSFTASLLLFFIVLLF